MKTQIVKIGNSHGVRIPKIFLKETDIGTDVEMEVRNRQIIIRPANIRDRDGKKLSAKCGQMKTIFWQMKKASLSKPAEKNGLR